ncbi:MAG: peptide chain release factor 2 [Candidatus Spechtbacteria bacterium]|nr:peptide chain release factor 2 [Candidatus Spechtbacteria bacterium]
MRAVFDLPEKQFKISELEKETAKKDFWDNPSKAAAISQELSDLKEEQKFWDGIQSDIAYMKEIASLSDVGDAMLVELENKIVEFEKKLAVLELKLFLSGSYDKNDCYVTIWSGAGGVDAQDWASMLLRMYTRYCERQGFLIKILDEHRGEEAGIKRVTFQVDGKYAYGYLQNEAGVHRLVRISPFSAQKLRHTSFAMVEVMPRVAEVSKEIEVKPQDVEMEAYRSSGPGGQNVNKVSTAVRLKHIPSGITVAVQSERSQADNRNKALEILKEKLYLQKVMEQQKEMKELRGELKEAEWGSQIRSYVLHPYQMVKDHRSGLETTRIQDVLDGNLQEFIEAGLRTKKVVV